jgi:hypothetical protein
VKEGKDAIKPDVDQLVKSEHNRYSPPYTWMTKRDERSPSRARIISLTFTGNFAASGR